VLTNTVPAYAAAYGRFTEPLFSRVNVCVSCALAHQVLSHTRHCALDPCTGAQAQHFIALSASRLAIFTPVSNAILMQVPIQMVAGNHEIEVQSDGTRFASFKARYPSPYSQSGSTNPLYYSFEVCIFSHDSFATSI